METCVACENPLPEDGRCVACSSSILVTEVLDLLNDLIEWDEIVMQSEATVWQRARAVRDRMVTK